ncbi:MAG TPA: hypothetical protein VNP03_17860, partial [Pseudonocardia sp.]|nr:hypothetical protein [Pseudonocardia sp.]
MVLDKNLIDDTAPDHDTVPDHEAPDHDEPDPVAESATQRIPADDSLTARGQALLDHDEDRHDEAIAVLRRAVAARE